MRVYRIANKKYKEFTLSGIGSEKVGGRWNKVGTRAVYCSENISLALLEYYVHSEDISTLPKDILVAEIELPPSFPIEEIKSLPKNWGSYPYIPATTKIFTEYVRDNNFFALKVPSSIIGLEFNYVLNPLYKDFGKVEITNFSTIPIDYRLREAIRSKS